MGFFSRIFKIGQAEAHAVADKLEDPIKMTEQGIRDLKADLDKSLQALAEVKAAAIRARSDMEAARNTAKSYEAKAVLLVQKGEKGEMDQAEADRLAQEALNRWQSADSEAQRHEKEVTLFAQNTNKLDANVMKLRSTINQYENELKTLKARARVSEATKKLNKSMANIDSSGTIAMLEKMKDKVAQDEALAEAYGDIALQPNSVDEEINAALGANTESDALAALKAKLKNNA